MIEDTAGSLSALSFLVGVVWSSFPPGRGHGSAGDHSFSPESCRGTPLSCWGLGLLLLSSGDDPQGLTSRLAGACDSSPPARASAQFWIMDSESLLPPHNHLFLVSFNSNFSLLLPSLSRGESVLDPFHHLSACWQLTLNKGNMRCGQLLPPTPGSQAQLGDNFWTTPTLFLAEGGAGAGL